MTRVKIAKEPYIVDPRQLGEGASVGEDASQPLLAATLSAKGGWKWAVYGTVALLAVAAGTAGVVVLTQTGDGSASEPGPAASPPAPPGMEYVEVVNFRTIIAGDVASFNRTRYRIAMADLLGVKPEDIELTVSEGSVIVDSKIVVRETSGVVVGTVVETLKETSNHGTSTVDG